jgi:hypothetical protein
MSSKPRNLQLDLIDKHAVIGGHEDGSGYMSIGRINYQNEFKIGKINSFLVNRAYNTFIFVLDQSRLFKFF